MDTEQPLVITCQALRVIAAARGWQTYRCPGIPAAPQFLGHPYTQHVGLDALSLELF
jgi:hypothetical protein